MEYSVFECRVVCRYVRVFDFAKKSIYVLELFEKKPKNLYYWLLKMCQIEGFRDFISTKFKMFLELRAKFRFLSYSHLKFSTPVFSVLLVLIGVAWSVCFCFARRGRNKRHARYHVLRGTTEPERKNKKLLLVNGGKQR